MLDPSRRTASHEALAWVGAEVGQVTGAETQGIVLASEAPEFRAPLRREADRLTSS